MNGCPMAILGTNFCSLLNIVYTETLFNYTHNIILALLVNYIKHFLKLGNSLIMAAKTQNTTAHHDLIK